MTWFQNFDSGVGKLVSLLNLKWESRGTCT